MFKPTLTVLGRVTAEPQLKGQIENKKESKK